MGRASLVVGNYILVGDLDLQRQTRAARARSSNSSVSQLSPSDNILGFLECNTAAPTSGQSPQRIVPPLPNLFTNCTSALFLRSLARLLDIYASKCCSGGLVDAPHSNPFGALQSASKCSSQGENAGSSRRPPGRPRRLERGIGRGCIGPGVLRRRRRRRRRAVDARMTSATDLALACSQPRSARLLLSSAAASGSRRRPRLAGPIARPWTRAEHLEACAEGSDRVPPLASCCQPRHSSSFFETDIVAW